MSILYLEANSVTSMFWNVGWQGSKYTHWIRTLSELPVHARLQNLKTNENTFDTLRGVFSLRTQCNSITTQDESSCARTRLVSIVTERLLYEAMTALTFFTAGSSYTPRH